MLKNKNVDVRRRRRLRHQGRADRPADRRRADEAQPGAQDRRLVHVLRPPAHDDRAGSSPTTPTAAAWTSPRSTARSSAPAAPLAREVASELSQFDRRRSARDEIGSPFAISGPGYFTDAAHQNHVHVGFKTEITPDWEPPPGLRADAPAAAPPSRRPRWRARPRPASRPRRAPPRRADGPVARVRPLRGDRAPRAGEDRRRRGRGRRRLRAVLRARSDEAAASPRRSRPSPPRRRGAAPAADVAAGAVDVSAVSDAYPGDDAHARSSSPPGWPSSRPRSAASRPSCP